jgi:hypothetical protein
MKSKRWIRWGIIMNQLRNNRTEDPVKVPEYLSMGLPTVCSAIGGITRTIVD